MAREGRPVETGAGRRGRRAMSAVGQVRELMVGKAEVLRAIGDGAVCTINALLPQQHAGAAATATAGPGTSPAA